MSFGPGVNMPSALTSGADAAADGATDGGAPALYTVTASPPPGVLIPGQASTVTVTGPPIASPAVNADPAAYAAQVTITTDVPLDPPHVVTLGETPLGDQLSFSLASPLRFGQVPIDTTLGQTFTVTNSANPGSPAANVSLVVGGSDAGVYTIAPASIASLGPGATSGTETITFAPTAAVPYPATLALQTSDPLCTALPAPIQVSGTGTNGQVVLSTSTLAFGTDPLDPLGLVNCGATGAAQTFTVTNKGNQAFTISGLALKLGASSPYTLSGTAAGTMVPIGQSVTITVTPQAIPATVANPSDPSPFTDQLTITTDVAADSPHVVNLVMQARGAVIANASVPTTWAFGTVSYGSIGTFTSTLQNTGNAPVTISLTGLAQPTIFTLQGEPQTAPGKGPGGAYAAVTGEFIPPSANGSWSDKGTLVLTAPQSFCGAPPMGWMGATTDGGTSAQAQWVSPSIQLSGSSNSAPPVTIAGSLAFPPSECGGPAPSGQSVTLTNNTNVTYGYRVAFSSGRFYTSNAADAGADSGTGSLASNGTATIVVLPGVPAAADGGAGPAITPGSAPFADNLLIAVENPDAGAPIASFTVPISWTLNGAVFVLPEGAGPNTDGMGAQYYPADTASGYTLPMKNTGNESASVTIVAEPQSGAFSVLPATIQVNPGTVAGPTLNSAAANACTSPDGGAAPALTVGTASFFYTGSVCQAFPLTKVTVESCSGTLQ
jgi:hypothetical protein